MTGGFRLPPTADVPHPNPLPPGERETRGLRERESPLRVPPEADAPENERVEVDWPLLR